MSTIFGAIVVPWYIQSRHHPSVLIYIDDMPPKSSLRLKINSRDSQNRYGIAVEYRTRNSNINLYSELHLNLVSILYLKKYTAP